MLLGGLALIVLEHHKKTKYHRINRLTLRKGKNARGIYDGEKTKLGQELSPWSSRVSCY